LQFDLITEEVRKIKLRKSIDSSNYSAIYVDPNGTIVVSGGINPTSSKVD
jgi:hypothetical protein